MLGNIEKLTRRFLLCDKDDWGMHYVIWESVCTLKVSGGLGVHHLLHWQGALLALRALRLLNNENTLLKNCIQARYGNLNFQSFSCNDSVSWKLICKGYARLQDCLSWEILNVRNVLFDRDQWLNGHSLARWPTLVNCLEDLLQLVSDVINVNGE